MKNLWEILIELYAIENDLEIILNYPNNDVKGSETA